MLEIQQCKSCDEEAWQNIIDVVTKKLAQLQEGLKKLCEIEEQLKLHDDDMRIILDGTISREMLILGFLNKEDFQGKGDIAMNKKLLDRRGILVRCFLCDENDFVAYFPMKTKLEWLQEYQVQQVEENLSTKVEVFQMLPPSKEMLEVMDAFKHIQRSPKVQAIHKIFDVKENKFNLWMRW